MKNIYSLLIIFIAFPSFLSAQNLNGYLREAKAAFDRESYASAFFYAEKGYQKFPDNAKKDDCLYLAGRSALLLGNYSIADSYLTAIEPKEEYTEYYYFLAETKKSRGEYVKAIEYYEKFRSVCSTTSEWTNYEAEVARGIAYCQEHQDDLSCADLEIKAPPLRRADISTKFADLAPAEIDNQFVFTSLSEDKESACGASIDLYMFNAEAENSRTEIFPNQGQMSEFVYSLDGNRVYYTLCECDETGEFRCNIFYKDRAGYDAAWGTAVPLDSILGVSKETLTNPHIARSPMNPEEEVLYFVSTLRSENSDPIATYNEGDPHWLEALDKLQGDRNIFYTTVSGGSFSKAQEMEVFNTAQNEITPFYHELSQTFYFSSNGWGGKGGMDIFSSKWNGENWEEPKPLCNINHIDDDTYFFINDECNKAYFSSTRDWQTTSDDCTPCPDIYEVELEHKLTIKVVVKQEDRCAGGTYQTEVTPLEGAKVVLENQTTYGAKEELQEAYTSVYTFEDKTFGDVYNLTVSKPGFFPYTCAPQAKEFACQNDTLVFEALLRVMPSVNLIVETFEKFGGAETIITDDCLGTSKPLQEAYAPEIPLYFGDNPIRKKLLGVKVMLREVETGVEQVVEDPNSNTYQALKVNYGQKYQLFGHKDNYVTDTLTIEFDIPERVDLVCDSTVNQSLYLFTPLPLYFNNARPRHYWRDNPNAYDKRQYGDTLVKLSYHDTYRKYHSQKSTFINNCYNDQEEIACFFDNELEEGMNRLRYFAPTFLDLLSKGYKLQLVIKGTASARRDTKSTYSNEDLSKRRISSMINYFRGYNVADENYKKLSNYIDENALTVFTQPTGDNEAKTKAEGGVCETWYGRTPSRERSVRILNIVITPPPGLSLDDFFTGVESPYDKLNSETTGED